MIFLFVAEDGTPLELDFPIGQCPVKIGDELEHEGRKWMRVPAIPLAQVAGNMHFTSVQLPFNYPFAPRHDKRGQPQFDSMKEVRECIAKAKNAGEPLHGWD